MRGDEIKKLCDESGLKAQVIYERAGYNREHYYKILKKKDISVDEFSRIAAAIGRKPGDLLENSAADMAPYLPLVEQLRQFSPNALPRIQEMLRAAASMLEENSFRDIRQETKPQSRSYNGGRSDKSDTPSVPIGVKGFVSPEPDVPFNRIGDDANVTGTGRHGSTKKGSNR
jgi:hypothetical protein